MARHETDREDLYEEFRTALRRWELASEDQTDTIVAAVRNDGRFCIYLTPDHTYQFNADNQLMRAYVDGQLYRTQGSTLACMVRHRTSSAVELVRKDLTPEELAEFCQQCVVELSDLFLRVADGTCKIQRSSGCETEPLHDFLARLRPVVSSRVTLAPPFPTKRS